MKIFPAPTSAPTRSSSTSEAAAPKEGKLRRKKTEGPIKQEMSEAQIKEKLAAHSSTTSDAAKNLAIKNTKKLGDGFMNPEAKSIVDVVDVKAPGKGEDDEIKTPNSKDLTLKTDIATNDPKDTNTQEKLKSALTRGAFNFNAKEREALEKILG